MNRIPIWAVLCPASVPWLETRLAALTESVASEASAPPWRILAGRGTYSAVLTDESSLTDAEQSVAAELSAELGGPVYAMRPRDAAELGPDGWLVWQFQRGHVTEEIREHPSAFAERLGCPLQPAAPTRAIARSLAVVEGVGPDSVRAAITGNPLLAKLGILPNRRGTVVYPVRGTGVDVVELCDALPEATVYRVISGPAPERFAVHVFRGESELGAFEADGTRVPGVPALDAIDGARTRAEILAELDVQSTLLGEG